MPALSKTGLSRHEVTSKVAASVPLKALEAHIGRGTWGGALA